MSKNHYRTLTGICKVCKSTLNRASHAEAVLPEVGDISVCAYCSTVGCFDEDFNLVKMSDEEFNNLDEETKIVINTHLENIKKLVQEGREKGLNKKEYDDLLMQKL
jgi:hypothetical protein